MVNSYHIIESHYVRNSEFGINSTTQLQNYTTTQLQKKLPN